jgi:hypothetical protein
MSNRRGVILGFRGRNDALVTDIAAPLKLLCVEELQPVWGEGLLEGWYR